MDQLPRLGKRELICLLSFTCNYVVFVWRGFLFLWVLGMGYVILLWHSLSLPYNYFISLQWLNVQSLKVGQTHQVWKAIIHDVRTVKRAYPKLRLLTGTYILQENRARFNQYTVRDCCLLCGAGAETRTHFIAGCSRLESIRVNYIEQLITILSRKKT